MAEKTGLDAEMRKRDYHQSMQDSYNAMANRLKRAEDSLKELSDQLCGLMGDQSREYHKANSMQERSKAYWRHDAYKHAWTLASDMVTKIAQKNASTET